MRSFKILHVLLIELALALASCSVPSTAASLDEKLSQQRPSLRMENVRLDIPTLSTLLKTANTQASIYIETLADAKRVTSDLQLPTCTLRDHIQSLASMFGYAWLVDGEWLVFYPKSRANDPRYALNKHTPSTSLIKDWRTYLDRLSKWMQEYDVRFDPSRSSAAMRRQLESGKAKIAEEKPSPMDRPALRDVVRSYYAAQGYHSISLSVRETRDPNDATTMLTEITYTLAN